MSGPALLVALIGIILTVLSAWFARIQYDHNENRLLALRVKEAGSVLSAAVPSIQTPLSSAADLAALTNGNPGKFDRYVRPYLSPKGPFVSISLWRPRSGGPLSPLALAGSHPTLTGTPSAAGLFARAGATGDLLTTGILNFSDLRIGYAVGAGGYVVYGESLLPKNRQAVIGRDQAFSDFDYALFLGHSASPQDLLESNVRNGALMGRQATVSIPLGDSALTLVMSPRRPLTGSLAEYLSWIVAGVGGAITLTGAGLTERLVRQRRRAEVLAETNAALYAEQRGVAKTLQHALLPEALPRLAGAVVAARYIAGVDGIDIGGDWYELIPVEDGKVLLVVGDVSGRGLRAATIMAELRYSTRAFSLDSSSPADIVSKLSRLFDIENGGEFATMLCALVDIGAHEVTLTNAGHPPPLIIEGQETRFVAGVVEVPIGVAGPHTYTSTKIKVEPKATLLAFTDGLIERRGETLEVGLQRLSDTVLAADGTLDEVLTIVASGLGGTKSDDTAILGLRWNG